MPSTANPIAPINVTGKGHAVKGDFLYLYMGTDNSVGMLSDQCLFLDQAGQLVFKCGSQQWLGVPSPRRRCALYAASQRVGRQHAPGPQRILDLLRRVYNKNRILFSTKTVQDAAGKVICTASKTPLTLAKWAVKAPDGRLLCKTRSVPGAPAGTVLGPALRPGPLPLPLPWRWLPLLLLERQPHATLGPCEQAQGW